VWDWGREGGFSKLQLWWGPARVLTTQQIGDMYRASPCTYQGLQQHLPVAPVTHTPNHLLLLLLLLPAVCTTMPPSYLLNGQGMWPTECADRKILVGRRCTAKCNSGYGAPTIVCLNDGWQASVTGACQPAPGTPYLPWIKYSLGLRVEQFTGHP
jgi:hypothetical protein